MNVALFVGRFQPMHIGHLKVIKWILKKYEKIVIAIGSSQDPLDEKNPFTFKERKKMIENTLKNEGVEKKRYRIISIPDAYDDEVWVKSILKKAKFNIVFTKNLWTKKCFDHFNIPVKEHPIFGNVSASKIRSMMKKGEKWEKFVPKEVEKILKRINLKKRLGVSIFSSFNKL